MNPLTNAALDLHNETTLVERGFQQCLKYVYVEETELAVIASNFVQNVIKSLICLRESACGTQSFRNTGYSCSLNGTARSSQGLPPIPSMILGLLRSRRLLLAAFSHKWRWSIKAFKFIHENKCAISTKPASRQFATFVAFEIIASYQPLIRKPIFPGHPLATTITFWYSHLCLPTVRLLNPLLFSKALMGLLYQMLQ